ncbi:MAG: chitin disaccharide deacetylase [Oscillospiraceae bacterium]|nr:chitin disaccharide deacetylase [Oscillospiraceae bacterium]
MKAIFNADDFGYSKGVNLGILEAYKYGVLRSTTIMPGMPGFIHAIGLSLENPGLRIGVHLTLTTGKSVGGVYKTITDGDGNFLRLTELERRAKMGEIDLAEVESEYEAQIQKVLATGVKPDHFDSHHHTHNLPGIVTVFLKLAKKYGVKVRIYDQALLSGEFADVKTTGVFNDTFFDENATLTELQRVLSSCGEDSIEIMCHPAYVDNFLLNSSSYTTKRAYELDVLTSPDTFNFIAERGIELSSFSDLPVYQR